MSHQYNTAYQRQQRDRRFSNLMEKFDNASMNDGWHEHDVIRLEWRKSSYMLFFEFNGYERHINIIDECRKMCGRLTKATRVKIEANVPQSIHIHTSAELYYSPGCPYNIGGYRYVHYPKLEDLEQWLSNL